MELLKGMEEYEIIHEGLMHVGQRLDRQTAWMDGGSEHLWYFLDLYHH